MAKVAIITESFAVDGKVFAGGAERHTYQLARLATDAGADVTIYQPLKSGNEISTVEGVSVRSVIADTRGIWKAATHQAVADGCERFHYQYLAHVPRLAAKLHPSATHHGIYWDVPFDSRYAAWYPHGRLARLYLRPWRLVHKRRYLKAVRRCREVLAADTSLLRLVQSDLPDLRDRICVVPNFSDLTPTTKASCAAGDVLDEIDAAKRDGRLIVLVPRNLSFKQGIAFLPELVQIVAQRTDLRCQFVVTGQFIRGLPQSAQYERQLNKALASLPPESRARLTFLHGVKHRRMPYWYQAADIVVLPSVAGEATSLSAIEAMTFGRAVVATNIGGLNDVIEHRHTGMLVRARVDELADAIITLAQDRELRVRLGEAAQCTAKRRYSLETWKSLVLPFIDRNQWLSSDR